jgi:hypothetical protein
VLLRLTQREEGDNKDGGTEHRQGDPGQTLPPPPTS